MKNGVIAFYSWIGSTRVAAQEIGRLTGFALSEIREAKERKKGNIMGPAMAAFLGLRSRIRPLDTPLAPFSDVFLGTPVWAGKTPPAINKFLSRADLRGKRVWLFVTQSDVDAPGTAVDSVVRRVGARGGRVMDVLRLKTRWDPKTNVPIPAEDLRGPIAEWVEKITPRMKEG